VEQTNVFDRLAADAVVPECQRLAIELYSTEQSGTPSRSNPAPENGRKRHLITE
jgi:hypothetical protein